MLTSPRRRCWKLTVRVTCSNLLISLSVPSHAMVSIVIDSVPPAGISLQEVQYQNQNSPYCLLFIFCNCLCKNLFFGYHFFVLFNYKPVTYCHTEKRRKLPAEFITAEIKFRKLYNCIKKNKKIRTSWFAIYTS